MVKIRYERPSTPICKTAEIEDLHDLDINLLRRLNFYIDSIWLKSTNVRIKYETGEEPDGDCMWGPCHLPIAPWLGFHVLNKNIEDLDALEKIVREVNPKAEMDKYENYFGGGEESWGFWRLMKLPRYLNHKGLLKQMKSYSEKLCVNFRVNGIYKNVSYRVIKRIKSDFTAQRKS